MSKIDEAAYAAINFHSNTWEDGRQVIEAYLQAQEQRSGVGEITDRYKLQMEISAHEYTKSALKHTQEAYDALLNEPTPDPLLVKVRELAERIARCPDLPNPDRDADWKNCQQWSSHRAREILALIDGHTIQKR